MQRLLENVNALAFSLVSSELRAATATASTASAPASTASIGITTDAHNSDLPVVATVDDLDRDHPLFKVWSFQPDVGNVIFASAIDCWGFQLPKFAGIWAKKLGVNRGVLLKYMFENYSFNTKTKKLIKCDNFDGTETGKIYC